MSIKTMCQCGKRISAKQTLAGKLVKCPDCQESVNIPEESDSGKTRCSFCHEFIPIADYNQHREKHLSLREDGQQEDYATLPPEERKDPVSFSFEKAPRSYLHSKCGVVTGMPEDVIQTYLQNPWFYLADATFCCGCGKHVPNKVCHWVETGENLQTYMDKLRAKKPEMKPKHRANSGGLFSFLKRLFSSR